jgi:hypothetical protein
MSEVRAFLVSRGFAHAGLASMRHAAWYQVFIHHHQPINVPTAGAQAFFMDYAWRTGHNQPRGPSADW